MALRKFLPDFVNYLDVENITPFLISKNLLSLEEKESLKSHSRDHRERVMELVRILERKGPKSYVLFREALQNSVGEDNVDTHLGHVELVSKLLPSNPLLDKPTEKLTECVQETAVPSGVAATSAGYTHTLTDRRDFFLSSQDSGMLSGSFGSPMQHPLEGGASMEPQLSFASEHKTLVGHPREDAGAKLWSALSYWKRQLVAETCCQGTVEDLVKELLLKYHKLKETHESLLREKAEMEHCMRFCMPVIHSQHTAQIWTGRVERPHQSFFCLIIEYMDCIGAERCITEELFTCITGQPLSLPKLTCGQLCPVELQHSEHTVLLLSTSIGELLPIGFSPDLVITVHNEIGTASQLLQQPSSWQHRVEVSLTHCYQHVSTTSDHAQISTMPVICLPLDYRNLPCFEHHLQQFLQSCMENATRVGKEMIQQWRRHIVT